MLLLALLIFSCVLAGGIGGALAARWVLSRSKRQADPTPSTASDPSLTVSIEQTAAVWSKTQGRPEATGLMADKLRLVYGIGQRRGWW